MKKIGEILQTKWFHILFLVIGIVFVLLGAFHTELWYDESYTIALLQHNIPDIIRITIGDVHPVLYYLLLKILTLPFNNSIISARLFSIFAGILMGILGYTHIRKDFGAKVGLAFSFLTFFLPFMALYGLEIRMYTWTMLFVSLSGIYAYRSIKNNKTKNWLLFAIFSLCAAYCHYYGLAAVAIINGFVFLHIAFSKKLYENEEITKKSMLIHFALAAALEILLYLPWLPIFLKQATAVSKGYWIQFSFAESIAAPLGVQFNGRLSVNTTILFTVLMYVYLIYQMICAKKQKQNITVLLYCLLVHFILYFTMLMVTILVKPIMYFRYMLVTSGILIFPFAYSIANNTKKHQKIITIIMVVIIMTLGIYNNILIVKESYGKTNGEEITYIKEKCKNDAIIVYKDLFHATNIQVQIPEYNWYFYNIDENHDIKPYENFSPPLNIIFDESFLQNYHGRIIIIDHDNLEFYNELQEKYGFTKIEEKKIALDYREIFYRIIVVEKT